MTAIEATATRANQVDDDYPSSDGEALVAKIRIVLAGIFTAFTAVYSVFVPEIPAELLYPFGILSMIWAGSSLIILRTIRRGHYRNRISYISTVADILLVTLFQLQSCTIFSLNFSTNLIPSLFFLTIGLTAVRRCTRLVILSGVLSAIVFLAINGFFFLTFEPEGYSHSSADGRLLCVISFIDQVAKAMTLVVFGWLIGHVARSIRRSERQYHELFENIPDGVLIATPDLHIVTVNNRMAKMAGISKEALIGRPWTEIMGRRDGRTIPSSAYPNYCVGNPTALIRPDGSLVPVLTRVTRTERKDEQSVVMSVRDMTGQSNIERQLARSQKMETLGKLAGGLTHDFNNLLGGILGAVSVSQRTLEKLPERQRGKLEPHLLVVRECADSARDLVKKLLSFARKTEQEAEPVDLVGILDDVAIICRKTFDDEHTIEIDCDSKPSFARVVEANLTQAILNLCINARDSMPDGGKIVLGLRSIVVDRHFVARHPEARPGSTYWGIEIVDQGRGMDTATMENIFDPFYSTKKSDVRAGLGLPMAYGIAQQHGGFLDVSSSIGSGSTFTVFIPAGPESSTYLGNKEGEAHE